ILPKQKSKRGLSLQRRRTLPVAGVLKTASAEATGDAGVVVAAAAMAAVTVEVKDAAMGAAMGAIGARSRGWHGLLSRVLQLPSLLLRLLSRVTRSQGELSSLDRRQDISPFCFPENRFPSIVGWPIRQQYRSDVRRITRTKPALPALHLQPPLPYQIPRPLWPQFFRRMSPSLPARMEAKRRMGNNKDHVGPKKTAAMPPPLLKPQLRS